MSKICDLTKKKVMAGNNVSHAKNRRRRVFEPNLHNHKLWSDEQIRWISLKISNIGLRIIDNIWLDNAIKKYGLI